VVFEVIEAVQVHTDHVFPAANDDEGHFLVVMHWGVDFHCGVGLRAVGLIVKVKVVCLQSALVANVLGSRE
jgi:hypothetical protein